MYPPRLSHLSLSRKFTIISGACLLAVAAGFGWAVSRFLGEAMVRRSIEMTVRYISDEFPDHFSGPELSEPKRGPEYARYAERIGQLGVVRRAVRVKIWNPRSEVVWADDPGLVGKRFPDNHELQEALRGEVEAEISDLVKVEQTGEREHGRLLELYVPLRFSPGGPVEAVAEIYEDLGPLDEDVRRAHGIIWIGTALAFGLLHVVLSGFVWRANRRMEAQRRMLARSEERHRTLVESARDGIVSLDDRGRVVLFNAAAEKIFGVKAREVLGNSFSPLLSSVDPRLSPEVILQLCSGVAAPPERGIEALGLRGGIPFPIEVSLSVARKDRRRVVTAFVHDLTEQKEMHRQLIQAERQASLSLLAGSIGHELNNSVLAVMGYAEMLSAAPEDRSLARRCADVFLRQSQRFSIHAQNLLELSKPRTPDFRHTDLSALVDRTVEMLRISGLLKRYEIFKQYSVDLHNVHIDETLVEQVIRNLLINAAHAMGDLGRLTVGTAAARNGRSYVEFSVADTGPGIPEDLQEKIFMPFFTTKEEGKGTGLGLHISKQVVAEHGGYIRLESRLGAGTVFRVGFPAASGSGPAAA